MLIKKTKYLWLNKTYEYENILLMLYRQILFIHINILLYKYACVINSLYLN
jgi:hypothetical protein